MNFMIYSIVLENERESQDGKVRVIQKKRVKEPKRF